MPKPITAWMRGGLWLAFFIFGLWLGLRIYGHHIWYSGEAFASVVSMHIGITLFGLIPAVFGMIINIRLGLAAVFATQAVLSAITSKLARMKDKWEAPDVRPDFADTHTAYLADVFQVISLVSWALLLVVAISLFWKKKAANSKTK